MQKILLVEDQPDIQLTVKALLAQRHEVVIAASAAEALSIVSGSEFDLILLDVTLPDANGFRLFSRLKEEPSLEDVPIIFLTGKAEVTDRVTGFSLGADDYIVKPFEPLEFRARIDAKLQARLSKKQHSNLIRKGRLELDRAQFKAFASTEGSRRDLDLTPHEFKLLLHFLAHLDQVLTRDQLMTAAWGADVHVLERTIDRHVSALRRKLDPAHELIESVHGIGYRFSLATSAKRKLKKKAA